VPRLSMSKTHLYMFICLYFTFKWSSSSCSFVILGPNIFLSIFLSLWFSVSMKDKVLYWYLFRQQMGSLKITNLMIASIAWIHLLLSASWIQFWFVSFVLKYLNFTIVLTHLINCPIVSSFTEAVIRNLFWNSHKLTIYKLSGFSGLGVSVLASGTQVRGFKPSRRRRIFKGGKILSTPSFRREVKPWVPCCRFAARKRSLKCIVEVGILG
jgi:hypothetical protein